MLRRATGVLVGLVMGPALTASTNAVAATAARPAPWHLEDYAQSACFSAHVTDSYYGIYIDGRWKRSIDVGAANLPEGGGFTTSYAPIPPGSSDGEHSLAYVQVTLPSDEPLGTYTASLWASNGRVRQTVPITLVVRSRCGY